MAPTPAPNVAVDHRTNVWRWRRPISPDMTQIDHRQNAPIGTAQTSAGVSSRVAKLPPKVMLAGLMPMPIQMPARLYQRAVYRGLSVLELMGEEKREGRLASAGYFADDPFEREYPILRTIGAFGRIVSYEPNPIVKHD